MLEIRRVSKTYRPKKGVPVLALNDVSLTFGDTGLVFILGKSGSGKSTLLNVVGGLDRADEGEFLIEGKSSKDFKGGDFDSYRNTFIGFIFQEYNILNEFNVAQNVALAMELQGKKATQEKLREILEEVDLSGFGGRKPNELSGGQKQRVAIARALVKDPKIIMADEPTGALDSNTGAQVFDTLKKLSKTKLVLVVSHDREFAEYYGDRVIELADGKIVSDILKYRAAAEKESAGVSVVDGDILRIEPGYELTEKDLEFINAYLKEHKGETIISSDKRANDGLKRAAMIDEKGSKESFRETSGVSDEELGISEKDGKDAKFVRSRMPFSKAFKMGASSLKTKPVRLFFTILLSFFALAMFGLADTLAAYNKVDNTVLSIRDNNVKTAAFRKGGDYTSDSMNDGDIARLNAETGKTFKGVFNAGMSAYSPINLPNLWSHLSTNNYYTSQVSGFYELEESELGAFGFERIAGRLPVTDGEVAVPNYLYECYKEKGYSDSVSNVIIKKGELTPDDGANGLIGKTLRFNEETAFSNGSLSGVMNADFTVVGIYDTKLPEKFEALKQENTNDISEGNVVDYMVRREFETALRSALHAAVFVNPGFAARKIAAVKAANGETIGCVLRNDSINFMEERNIDGGGYGFDAKHIMKLSDVSTDEIVWTGDPVERLGSDQMIVSFRLLQSILSNYRDLTFDKTANYYEYGQIRSFHFTDLSKYSANLSKIAAYEEVNAHGVPTAFLTGHAEEIQQYYQNYYAYGSGDYEQCKKEAYTNFLSDSYDNTSGYNVNPYGKSGKYTETAALLAAIQEADMYETVFSAYAYDQTYEYGENGNPIRRFKTGNVVGVYAGNLRFLQNQSLSENSVILPDAAYAEHAKEEGYFSRAVAPMPDSAAEVLKLVEYHYRNADAGAESNGTDDRFLMSNEVISSFDQVNFLIETLSEVFLYIGIGLAVFSAFLLANFIAVSISNKKREIGILRAVGAKSSDVFTIFFSESFLIAVINFILALAGTIAGSIVLNNVFSGELGMAISLLNFGVRQIGLMLGVSLLVSVAASFLPVWFIAKKRPIEAIRGR